MAVEILLGLAALLGALFLIRRFFWLGRDTEHVPRTRKPRAAGTEPGGAEPTPTPPASVHPVINENRCIGCGSCLDACPEGDVIGIVDFETRLVNPSRCMGHGACAAACPMDAITLMLDSSARGVNLPETKPNYASQIPGLYIVGELGGMGLIRNAIEQGRQAMESIRRQRRIGEDDGLDVVIVGAGPAGLSASLAAMGHQLRYVTLEQGEIGASLRNYPRKKVVLSAPAKLPVFGEVALAGMDKEALAALWQDIARDTGVKINYRESVETITRTENGFLVRSSAGEYQTRFVLLATGRGGTPQKLGIPGEDLPKVTYRLSDPGQYRNRRVLVVGSGDSAVDAAIAIALAQPQSVTLAFASEDLSRCSKQNREHLREFELTGRIHVMPQSRALRIAEKSVEIQSPAGTVELPNDDVVISIGGTGPDALLKSLGLPASKRADALWSASER